MKKIILLTLGCFVILCSCVSKPSNIKQSQLTGMWQTDNVAYTFIGDSLYVDEIDNEGFGYTYFIEDNLIVAKDGVFPEPFVFEIVSLTDTVMQITIYGEDVIEDNKFILKKVK